MAVDYFLKVDGIDGESEDSKHSGEIDLESFSWGETQTGSHSFGGGGGAGKVQMQDFHFVMKHCNASPKLSLACAEDEHIKKGVLTCRKAGKEQQEYLKVTMSDLLISSYQTSGSSHGDEVPTDQVSLNFSKIEFEYKDQKADGTLGGTTKTGYDVKAMKKV
jgi:type VI secretion system secreted protein Hcp